MFYLPFRERGGHSKAVAAKELTKQFTTDMQPETVLFLRKLTSLHVTKIHGMNKSTVYFWASVFFRTGYGSRLSLRLSSAPSWYARS